AVLVGDEPAIARLRAIPAEANACLARAIAELGIELRRSVQYDKLSSELLKVRSGALRSSIDLQVEQTGTSVTATISTDLDYGRAHEYGFAGTVNVRASLRRIREAFGRPIAEKTISVRAYSRRMDLPGHSFLRSALEGMTPQIQAEIDAALQTAVSR